MVNHHCVQVRFGSHVVCQRTIGSDDVALAYANAMCKRFPSLQVYDNDQRVYDRPLVAVSQ